MSKPKTPQTSEEKAIAPLKEELFRIGDNLDDEFSDSAQRHETLLERFADLEARLKAMAHELAALKEEFAEFRELHEESDRNLGRLTAAATDTTIRLTQEAQVVEQWSGNLKELTASMRSLRDDSLGILERLGALETHLARLCEADLPIGDAGTNPRPGV